jgi:hypothetical protein
MSGTRHAVPVFGILRAARDVGVEGHFLAICRQISGVLQFRHGVWLSTQV